MGIDLSAFRFNPEHALADYSTSWQGIENPAKKLKKKVARFARLQERLYADDRFSVLLIFQGMDAAGKDSTIKAVTSGVNPMGFEASSFKQPTSAELEHNFLWRCWRAMPERGRIGVFNRSYYEEVLVVRVHPEILDGRPLPEKTITDTFWTDRFDDFRHMESHLHRNGTLVLKFFLNVSAEEQRKRLLRRLRREDKHWKFNPRDVRERAHWDDYQQCYAEAIAATHTDASPWFIIPADDKPTMRALVASIIVDELKKLPIDFPAPAEEDIAQFAWAKEALLAEETN